MRTALARLLVLLPLAVTSLRGAERAPAAPGEPLPADAALPKWPAPDLLPVPADAYVVRSKNVELVHARDRLGGFIIRVAGETIARGEDRPQFGFLLGGQLRWLDSAKANGLSVSQQGSSVAVRWGCEDEEGARWEFQQRFSPGGVPGTIALRTELKVDRDRSVAFAPMVLIFPGAGTFGAAKGQGLFAGLEYLENEPSSSEADVIGPASKREVPDNLKITFPLMAIENEGHYVALSWNPGPQWSAVFDSPDRLFGSHGHAIGLLFPGSDGHNRTEGDLLPRTTELVKANQPLVLEATIMGGVGGSVVPAIQQYVALRGLPPLPEAKMDLQDYASLAAGGWLDSKIREGNLFRHAAAPNFGPGPVADVPVWMEWLACQTQNSPLAARLRETAQSALAQVAPADWDRAAIGHVRYPVASLVYGHVAENAERARQAGRELLTRFESDGSIRYRAPQGGADLSKTHYTNEANGLTARTVLDVLEAAAVSGDRASLEGALNRLRDLNKFRDGVPRGAQTWECPLHTPDILASALLVRAYTLGYELSGERDFLEQARYWAWTGVPFVYLADPTTQAVGRYSTIAVFGATQWRAPVWLGLPVQWCGLVYADALYRLLRCDPDGPWKRLADGITRSGIEQSWPSSDAGFQGLLPDSFVLRAQKRNRPAINPGTVEACAANLYEHPVYDFWCFRQNGLRVHAPGEISQAKEKPGRVSFEIENWLGRPCHAFINGLTAKPQLRINGKAAECGGENQFLEKEGWLILELQGKTQVELSW